MDLQQQLKEIDHLKQELDALLPIQKENKESLDRKFRLEFQFNTNHIEGNTLTYSETELILIFDETRGSHSHREYEEMKGSDVAYELIEELAGDSERPLTESFIKNINQVLLVRPYWKEAVTEDGQNTRRKIKVGDYKEFPNSVKLQNGEIFHYASPIETPSLMGELIQWYKAELEKGELHPVVLASLLHYKFVRIHPFDDGNGRISRLLLNYVLLLSGFPPVIIKSEDKINYLRALRDADTGNLDSFANYIARQLKWSLDLSLRAARNESIDETDDWKKDLTLLKRELEGKETINVKKSEKVIADLIKEEIFPFGRNLRTNLTDFTDLFLSTGFYFYARSADNNRLYNVDRILSEEDLKFFVNHNITLYILFKEFRKKTTNPFTLSLEVDFELNEYNYSVKVQNNILFTNLYHNKISEGQLKLTTNTLGAIVVEQIKNGLK